MAKKFGKIVLGAVAISAAVGGAYYYLTKKNQDVDAEFEDEDFDAFDVEFDDDDTSRSYTTLDSVVTKDEVEDTPVSTAKEEAEELINEATATLNEANNKIEDFFNDEQA